MRQAMRFGKEVYRTTVRLHKDVTGDHVAHPNLTNDIPINSGLNEGVSKQTHPHRVYFVCLLRVSVYRAL